MADILGQTGRRGRGRRQADWRRSRRRMPASFVEARPARREQDDMLDLLAALVGDEPMLTELDDPSQDNETDLEDETADD